MPDQTAELEQSAKPRKKLVFLSKAQWVAARFQYETGELTGPQLSAKYDVSLRTIRLKMAKEQWKKGLQSADGAERQLHSLVSERLPAQADAIAMKVGQRMEESMAPWFEREKRKWVKESVKIAKAGRKMVRAIVEKLDDTVTPKDAAYIAKSDDTYDNIGRRNLGMQDGNAVSGALHVQILAGQAAVSVSQSGQS